MNNGVDRREVGRGNDLKKALLAFLAFSILLSILIVIYLGSWHELKVQKGIPVKTMTTFMQTKAEKIFDLGPLPVNRWFWPREEMEAVEYVVGARDTIWGIAERYFPNQDPRLIEWAIRRINNLEGPKGPLLRPGQVILIPDPMRYGVGKS